MRVRLALMALLIWAAVGLKAPAAAAADAPHVHVELLAAAMQAQAGPLEAALHFQLEPGWHIYWINPGDAGEPVKVSWTLPAGVSAAPLRYLAPKRLPLGPLMDYGYEQEAWFPATLKFDAGLTQPAHLAAKVSWIVCQASCIPGHAQLDLDLPPAAAGRAVLNPAFAAMAARFEKQIPRPLPAGTKAGFAATQDGFKLTVETGRSESAASFFPLDQDLIDNPAPQKFLATARGFTLELKKDSLLKEAPKQLRGLIELSGGRVYEIAAQPGAATAQAVQATPQTPRENTAKPVAPQAPATQTAAPIAPTAPAPPMQPATTAGEVLRAVLLALAGGLLLNLMPCVFPVLFLKGLALINSGAEERRSLRLHGLVYAAGILVSFWALVGALEALRAAGATLGWGFQFQSPVFVALMAGLLFFLGLSLAGQFEIGLTLTSAGGSLAQKQGYAGSFFTGILAVIVATPCTAPLMGAAIGYALAQSWAVTLAVFTALAIGLALPYVALTLQPAWTRWLPRPGAWMEVLRQAVAVPIFATVVGLVWVLATAYGANLAAAVLAGFVLLAVAGWFLGRWPARRWATMVAFAVIAAVAALDAVAPSRLEIPIQNSAPRSGEWSAWSGQAVDEALSAGHPVFVDFTASWCLSCQVNERVALTRPEVMQAFRAHGVVLLKADWTRHDEAITHALSGLGRSGVPTYVLYSKTQSNPRLLPEALTPGLVLDAVNGIEH